MINFLKTTHFDKNGTKQNGAFDVPFLKFQES